MGSPILDPERDLKDATPETLARALLRPRRRPVDRVAEQKSEYGKSEESRKNKVDQD